MQSNQLCKPPSLRIQLQFYSSWLDAFYEVRSVFDELERGVEEFCDITIVYQMLVFLSNLVIPWTGENNMTFILQYIT